MWWLRGGGDGSFVVRPIYDGALPPRGVVRSGPEVGDVNGDGLLDAVVPVYGTTADVPTLLVFTNEGAGRLVLASEVLAGEDLYCARLGDLDGDGLVDVAVASADTSEVRILSGNGDGTFGPPQAFFGGKPWSLKIHDFNGDGALDLGVIGGSAYVLLNRMALRSTFKRGDVNADGTRNLADAVSALGYLFAGGRVPGCLDAADANDDGVVGLADAIRVLGHLFGGAGPLPEPFEACGDDPTGTDPFGCVEFRPCR
jgi:hypothetical protein